jgi:CubicO group peptidase (beta-lactamase class C family)
VQRAFVGARAAHRKKREGKNLGKDQSGLSMRQMLSSTRLLTLALLIAASPVTANSPDAVAIEEEVDRLLTPLVQRDLVSGSVLIARGGEILLAKGYGQANREHSSPNTPETVYGLASVTKSLTAIAILQLVEQGKLSLDDTIARHLPGYPSGDRITLHHLLTHTSGIRSYVFIRGFGEKERLPLRVEEIIEWFRDEPLQFEPGERFSYSNSGYALLTYIIQKVSGESYADYLQRSILEPAGMIHSGADSYTRVVKGRATGHSRDGCTGKITRAGFREPSFAQGVGSVYSTVLDLYRLDRALHEGRLLRTNTQRLMLRPQVETPWGHEYAYGWLVGESHGRRIAHHEGTTRGFATSFRRFVDDDLLVVALFNQDLIIAEELFSRLDAIALRKPWKPLLASSHENEIDALASYLGTYSMEPEGELVVSSKSGRLYIQEPGCSRFEVWPMSPTRGFATEANALLVFTEDEESGKVRIRAQYGILRWTGERTEPAR